MRLSLPFHSYQLKSLPASSTRLVNCYAEVVPEGKGPLLLKRAPGIAAWGEVTSGLGRGIHTMAGVAYGVIGNSLYSFSSVGFGTFIGTIAGTKPCWMTDNGTQLVIGTDGGTWYVYDGTLTEITDVDFTSRGARSASFLANYISFVEPNSGRWFTSNLADATDYNSLDFATAESHPDNLVTHAVDHGEAVLIGEETTELWYNDPNAGSFPFSRNPNGIVALGGAANRGVCSADNSVLWLASDVTIRRVSGQTPVRLSQHGVEEQIRGYSTLLCRAYSWTFNGHIMAAFVFPEGCFVLDVTTGEFHERQSYGYSTWNISGVTQAYGKVLVQNSLTGAIGYMSSETYTEFGDIQRAEWTYQPVYNDHDRLTHSSLEIVCESGVGLLSGQGSDPQITLELSNDGGRTWLTLPTKTIGQQGQYKTRACWYRLGMSRDRVYRGSITDPVPLTIFDTQLELA